MLKIRPNCESCDKDLAPDATDAFICSFECTFCRECADTRFGLVCPNCRGNLVTRPVRPVDLLSRYPASTERVTKRHS
jgi:hypothetical protein